ncbi:MAG: antitoxin [Myxococcota bacterium]
MTKRMQVLIDDAEYRRIQHIARLRGLTLAEWVRQALRAAYREEPRGNRNKKLAAVRAAAAHEFPTADSDQLLAEIAAGYGDSRLA